MNVFLNENWDAILKELKPAIIQAISEALKSFSNHIFIQIPYKQIIPAWVTWWLLTGASQVNVVPPKMLP